MASSPIISWQMDGETMKTVRDFIFLSSKSLQMVTTAMKLRHLLLGRKAMTNLDSILKNRDITLPTKFHQAKVMVFWVVMCECESWFPPKNLSFHKESWAPKNWCFWTVVLEKTFECPLDYKEIKPVHPKVNQSWIFSGRTDAEVEAPKLWPPDAKNWLIWKDPDAGKDWRHEEKGMTEDKMVEWHHRLNGHEFELALGDGEGQESLACCSPRGCKESDTTEQQNNKEGEAAVWKGKIMGNLGPSYLWLRALNARP